MKLFKFIYSFLLLSLVLSLQLSSVLSQSSDNTRDSVRIYDIISQTKILADENKNFEALNKAEEAMQVSMQTGFSGAEALILKIMGDCYFKEAKYSEAIPLYLRSAAIIDYQEDKSLITEVYTHIADCYNKERIFDKEMEYYIKTLSVLHFNDSLDRQILYEKIGVASLEIQKTDTAIFFFQKMNDCLLSRGEDNTSALNHLILSYRLVPEYDTCILFSKELLQIYSSKNNYSEMSALHNNIGYYHTLLGRFDSASISYKSAIENAALAGVEKRKIAIMTANAGICFQNMGKKNKAKGTFREALSMLKDSEYAAERSRIENILALTYFNEDDLYNAGFFGKNAIESAELANDPELLRDAYLSYSQVLKQGNDPENALAYYEKYLNIRDSIDLAKKLSEEKMVSKKLQLSKSENELQLRLKEEKVRELAFEQLNLQLEKEEQARDLLQKESDFQLLEQERLRQSMVISQQKNLVDKQERENRILEQENRIAEMRQEEEARFKKEQEKEILLLEKQQRVDQLEIEKQESSKKALKWIVGLMVMVAILILGNLITTRKKNVLLAKRKSEIEEKNVFLEQQNEEIMAQRDEIEAQRNTVFDQKEAIEQYNTEIMKSIEYAKRIQSSALSDLSILDNKVGEYFLMFRPRDIVSGDFYWLGYVENKTILTVADSTGHGVPGAFMSMLGISLLKELILKEYITHPGVILRRLRKEIVNALGQKGVSGEQRDGMDMALISIDHESGIISYAGAYNSLYLVRKTSLEAPDFDDMKIFESEEKSDYRLYDIPADKMPIAYFDRMDKFTSRDFKIYEGDMIYLFTDGFADQFGGVKGKKFMYKPFKRLILNNAGETMASQNKILSNILDKWMTGYEQVDDICIMGIKI